MSDPTNAADNTTPGPDDEGQNLAPHMPLQSDQQVPGRPPRMGGDASATADESPAEASGDDSQAGLVEEQQDGETNLNPATQTDNNSDPTRPPETTPVAPVPEQAREEGDHGRSTGDSYPTERPVVDASHEAGTTTNPNV
jgi:hypothetical protein